MTDILFDSLQAQYSLESEYVIDNKNYYQTVFHCVYHIVAIYDRDSKIYDYKIDRSNVLINKKPLSKLMDKIICEIGKSIYPINLKVNLQMQILDIVNYEEIKKRWITSAKKSLDKYSSSQLKRYIRQSYKNVSNKTNFINSLFRDTFFNLYFRDIYIPTDKDEANSILWVNFPKKQMNQTYLYKIAPIKDDKIETTGNIMQIVPTQNGTYKMNYEIGSKREITSIKGSIETKHQNKLYKKYILVKAEKLTTSSHPAESVIL